MIDLNLEEKEIFFFTKIEVWYVVYTWRKCIHWHNNNYVGPFHTVGFVSPGTQVLDNVKTCDLQ